MEFTNICYYFTFSRVAYLKVAESAFLVELALILQPLVFSHKVRLPFHEPQ